VAGEEGSAPAVAGTPPAQPGALRRGIETIGGATLRFVRFFGGLALVTADSLGHVFLGPFRKRPVHASEMWEQMVRVGPRSLLVVFQVNFFVGMILALIGGNILMSISTGFTAYVGDLMSVGIVLELGPLLTAIIMAGYIGAALTAEIGTMVVTEEVTALRTSGLNPMRYLVAPRLIATITMIPCVTLLGDVVGILGGLVVAENLLGVSWQTYYEHGVDRLKTIDIWHGLEKSCVFGLLIGAIGCYQGFQVKGGAEGVGRATTQSVVSSIMLVITADAILNYFLLFR
jgi:phospholipid/cholesterol/gamma-HCH transport system permease protein